MTDREKAIVMAYTGYCMLAGDKLSVFYEYVESIMGRPVYTHEMGTKVVDDLIKEKARPDFIALCADESSSEKPNKWIPVSERLPEDYADVIATVKEHYKDEIGYFVFPQARYSREYGWEWPYEAGTDYWTGLNGVVAWMPLPEPYKASPTGAEGSE